MDPLDAWDYELPSDRIARYPVEPRDASRLLILPLSGGSPRSRTFSDLPDELREGDLLVVNDTRVLHARLFARRKTGGKVELLVLHVDGVSARALARPARKLRPGEVLELDGGGAVQVVGPAEAPGEVDLRFGSPALEVLDAQGQVPLPPYLERAAEPSDQERYQTIYAGAPGSSAAPTAGLHFTFKTFRDLEAMGVGVARVTLHVGLGTFRPLTSQDLDRGELHEERYLVPESTCEAIRRAREAGGRVIAVGTTSARTLESATVEGELVPCAGEGSTRLFLAPPARLRVCDGLITNFHLPRSSLLMLVACLCGRERLLQTYAHAVQSGYRFYSYGDAMLLL
ncbi:MAG: tRNA preQ1(34) S-adenosylmethionine ribosyltransferase-isomerase QueA [Deltaproteobacteria bacterium]|nr:MAG: tRNA preQ1(34) S-adenosylmethionine ribosyltransferase-isomerase QueA [Deltaproteobacteria bacterium]